MNGQIKGMPTPVVMAVQSKQGSYIHESKARCGQKHEAAHLESFSTENYNLAEHLESLRHERGGAPGQESCNFPMDTLTAQPCFHKNIVCVVG